MSKKSKSLTNKAGEVRELSRADFKNATPLSGTFPALAAYGRTRARKGEPVKQAVNIRLSPEVIGYFKSKGYGWQTRIDAALKAFVEAAR